MSWTRVGDGRPRERVVLRLGTDETAVLHVNRDYVMDGEALAGDSIRADVARIQFVQPVPVPMVERHIGASGACRQ